jgi:hypothetical protein
MGMEGERAAAAIRKSVSTINIAAIVRARKDRRTHKEVGK